MNGITLVVLIIAAIIGLIILWKIFKPYIMRHDTTICVCGGLGSGKTLTTLPNKGVKLIRKMRFIHFTMYNYFKKPICNFFLRIVNYFNRKHNLSKRCTGKKCKIRKIHKLLPWREKPMLYCNIPCHYKTHMWFWDRRREWALKFKASHMLLLEPITEYAVVVVDEFPQFINQFNWNQELIQKNVNEFITFFRHYIGGYFIINAQSIDDVVVQIRRKLNQATWCFDFHAWPFPFLPLFYTIRMCDINLSEMVTNISTTYIEENTRLHFGLFPPRRTYNSRCYSPRYKNVFKKYTKNEFFEELKTSKVLRLVPYTSPLDDTTDETQKQIMWEKGEKIWKN